MWTPPENPWLPFIGSCGPACDVIAPVAVMGGLNPGGLSDENPRKHSQPPRSKAAWLLNRQAPQRAGRGF
jgi:hypothetical protein